jgi:hypothetical protein
MARPFEISEPFIARAPPEDKSISTEGAELINYLKKLSRAKAAGVGIVRGAHGHRVSIEHGSDNSRGGGCIDGMGRSGGAGKGEGNNECADNVLHDFLTLLGIWISTVE